jgi:hypothetical protein
MDLIGILIILAIIILFHMMLLCLYLSTNDDGYITWNQTR